MRKQAIVIMTLVCVAVLAAPRGADARRVCERDPGSQALLWGASIVLDIAYVPLKAVYAIGGGIVGGTGLAFSQGEAYKTATNTVSKSWGGEWYLHPDVLVGERKLQFIGEPIFPDKVEKK